MAISSVQKRLTARIFLRTYIPLALVASVVMVLVYAQLESDHRRGVRSHEESLVTLESEVIRSLFLDHLSDAAFLSSQITRLYRQGRDPDFIRGELNKLFFRFCSYQFSYHQVRYVDMDGMEISRVVQGPGEPRILAGHSLQDLAGSEIFSKGMETSADEVYISIFDNSDEAGRAGPAVQAMIRFVCKVHDDQGKTMGLVVLDFAGNVLLQRLREASAASVGTIYLINPAVGWLVGPQDGDDDGFSFPRRRAMGFRYTYAEAWPLIRTDRSGQFNASDGLFTFALVQPRDLSTAVTGTPLTSIAKDYWKVVSVVPDALLRPYWADRFLQVFLAIQAIIGFFTLLWSLAKAGRVASEAELRTSQQRVLALSRAAQDGMVMIDDQGTVLFWNDSAQRIFGYTEQEILGNNLHGLLARPEKVGRIHEAMKEFSQTGQADIIGRLVELQARDKQGREVPVELAISAFRIDDSWYAVGNVRDISERKKYEAKLKEMASTDELTGLINRRRFMHLARAELRRSHRYNSPLSLVMLDIDHFKSVNDNYGHDLGDQVLRSFAGIGMELIRDSDILGRIGGEEFAMMLPETDLDQAVQAADRLRATLEKTPLITSEGPVSITVSAGVASLSRSDETLETLLKNADLALYRAKDNGRNRVEAHAGAA